MAQAHVALVGDSTIDNIVWVDRQDCTVMGQLQALLPAPRYAISNLAADGFTTADVLRGRYPAISLEARTRAGDPFPLYAPDPSARAPFSPLQVLRQLRDSAHPPSHVILSVGGNDIRVILGRMDKLPAVKLQFRENYENILTALMELLPAACRNHVIIATQYRPAVRADSVYRVYAAVGSLPIPAPTPLAKLNVLMNEMYGFVFALARTHRLAIADLTRTFDPFNDALYAQQIEPASAGANLIASVFAHIVSRHDFESAPSTFYFRSPGAAEVTSEPNSEQSAGSWVAALSQDAGAARSPPAAAVASVCACSSL